MKMVGKLSFSCSNSWWEPRISWKVVWKPHSIPDCISDNIAISYSVLINNIQFSESIEKTFIYQQATNVK